jgi:hypothetical protein
MTSLATLSHQTTPTVFNTDFYVTAATVIPVLFLALAVQGPALQNLLDGARAAEMRFYERVWKGDYRSSWGLSATTVIVLYGGHIIAGLILLLGVTGEITAIIALYVRHPVENGVTGTILTMAFLVVAVAVSPTVALWNSLSSLRKINADEHQRLTGGSPGQQQPPSSPVLRQRYLAPTRTPHTRPKWAKNTRPKGTNLAGKKRD